MLKSGQNVDWLSNDADTARRSGLQRRAEQGLKIKYRINGDWVKPILYSLLSNQ